MQPQVSVVPVASNVSSIPQFLGKFGTGRALDPKEPQLFVDAILWYIEHPDAWRDESHKAVQAAGNFSYESYLQDVRQLLDLT